MIVYNETYVMDPAIEQEWLDFMRNDQIPAIMKYGWFNTYKILTILDSPNEGVTYCVQFTTDKLSNYDFFKRQHLQNFHLKHNAKFENKFVLFNTVMQEV
ncbi:DUF4286 family protein [Mucilaginibacter myungsuensis]|uniref:DUF4286 family protein n=1 Tax=Mucilaginibacter myungsuensis TaxID=649104 RepID=A0A929PYJ6_9SPHI|nr:DUF4286 family protein [Mucilaginibacter myungsuensis]MBE9664234.1 DUF4286 family protein [Mucilaginibacter myungsuensis]MDN3599938.1 DUF4286 family protein [Mucilaginibacter myungsuensis]